LCRPGFSRPVLLTRLRFERISASRARAAGSILIFVNDPGFDSPIVTNDRMSSSDTGAARQRHWRKQLEGESMTGGEQTVVIAILAVFVFFMGIVAWGDYHSRGSRGKWD
jgi:hypothetical protein